MLPGQLVAINLQATTQLYTYDNATLTLTAAAPSIPQLPIPATAPYTVRCLSTAAAHGVLADFLPTSNKHRLQPAA